MEDNRELKKENELLKGINAALEKQLAFFRTMFKDTCLGSGPLLPVSLPNSDKEAVTFAPQKPQGAGIALGMACLVAMYNIRSDLTLPAEPQRRGEALGGRPSRALLSIEDQSGPVMQLGGAACSLRWMLLLGLLAFCLVSMLESGASLAGKSSNAVSIFCIEGRRSWRSESCRTLHEKVHWLRRILTCLALKVMMPQY